MRNIADELTTELSELDGKRGWLNEAIKDDSLDVTSDHRKLMKNQLLAMDHYAHALRMRIKDLAK